MKKLVPFIHMLLRSVKLGFAASPPPSWEVSLNEAHRGEAEREKLGRQMLKTISDAARKRFGEKVLVKLLGSGWTEGRKADADELLAMQRAARHTYPPTIMDVLGEFGVLKIYSGIGRSVRIGTVESELTAHQSLLEALVGVPLHAVGFTNVVEDDGLVLYADDLGRIFADGGTGYQKPGSSRIDYLAANFDRALEIMLTATLKYDAWPDSPASGQWHYDEPETTDPAACPELSPKDWQERLRVLSALRPGIEAHAALREKAVKACMELCPPASFARVASFEKASGIRLPDDYVFFITMIGNGGSRLISLEDWDAGYWSEARLEHDLRAPCLITPELEGLGEKWLDSLGVEDAGKKWDRDEWDPMRGTVTIVEYGCGLFFRMILNGPHRGRIFIWGEHALRPPVFTQELTFASWIGRWLDAAAAGQKVPFF